MVRCCCAINALAILSYAGLTAWALLREPAAANVQAICAVVALSPYFATIHAAKAYARFPETLALIFFLSLAGSLASYVDYLLIEAVHQEMVHFRQGARNCGPPVVLLQAFWLLAMPILQLGILGFATLFARHPSSADRKDLAPPFSS